MRAYPLSFRPLLKERVWGGTALCRFGHGIPSGVHIGESWEIADLPEEIDEGQSKVASGPLSGKTLRELLLSSPNMIMGCAPLWSSGRFPLLFKLLDARENLSVQVHPDEAYAAAHPEAHLKSEAWFVIDADPGAKLYIGLKSGVNRAAFEEAVAANRVEACLAERDAVPGSCHYLPGGTCHALGAGVLVAEMQTPSDTTYRIWDWGRSGRTLHLSQALACLRFCDDPPEPGPRSKPIPTELGTATLLTDTPYFSAALLDILRTTTMDIVTSNLPVIWLCLAGDGAVTGGDERLSLSPGVTALFPAQLSDGRATLAGGSRILEVRLPHPARDAIA